jgi:uncharacterized protein
MTEYQPPARLRGFAAMTPERRKEIAAQGGKAAHQKGTAHQWTSEQARDAGRKGHANRKVRKNMSATGSDKE